MKKLKLNKNKGMTLISLVVTIIVLIILATITIRLVLGDNGIINESQTASEETIREAATETMNLKITNVQIETYGKEQRMPTLQELADGFCEDEDFEYVELATKKTASLNKIDVGKSNSIFTKLKEYPYEFEINSSLQLASIDGVQVATAKENDTTEWKKLGTVTGQGSETSNYIDLSNVNFKELYIDAKILNDMYTSTILKDSLPTELKYYQFGFDIAHRIELGINANKIYITSAVKYDECTSSAVLTVYYR